MTNQPTRTATLYRMVMPDHTCPYGPKAKDLLRRQGYEVVGFLEPNPKNDDQQTIYLRLDKIERHTPDSLLIRNAELYKLAADFDLDGYDGMDVGAIDGP